MRTRAKGTSRAAVLAAGFVALGVTAIPSNAYADVTSGNGGVLSGNQIDAPISAPVDVSGNAAALLGTGNATSHGGATVHKRGGGDQKASGAHGIASGNQVNAPISVPVNVCGNAVGVLGHADAGCTGGAKVADGGTGGQVTRGAHGVIAGNQVNAPISVPVDVCGNAVAIAGDAVAGCEGGAVVRHDGNTGGGQEASGIFGIGSGNQANLPISVPVDVCGNAVGNGVASCAGGASVHDGHGTGHQIAEGAFGIITGDQVNAPISIPVTACGNAAALVGQARAFCEGGAHAHGANGSGAQTSGGHGVGDGDQVNTPVQVPAEVCGNAAAIIGTASALCEDAPGYGGYDGYENSSRHYRATGTPLPAALPAVPQNTLPQLDGVSTVDDLAQMSDPTNLGAVPPVNGRTADGDLLTTDGIASATNGVLNNTLPGSGSLQGLTKGPDGLATTGDLVGTDGLSRLMGLPTANRRAQGGLPGTNDVVAPNTLPKLDAASALNDQRVPTDLSGANGILPANTLPKGLALNGLSTANAAHTNGLLPTGDTALPATTLPALDGVSPVVGRRAQSGLPGTDGLVAPNSVPGLDGLPSVDGLVPAATLPALDGVSAVAGQRAKSGLPGVDGLVAPNSVPGLDGLPSVDGLVPATTLPALDGASPVAGQRAQGGLPGIDGLVAPHTLPEFGGVAGVNGRRVQDGLPSVDGLIPATTLPGLDGVSAVAGQRAQGGLPGIDGLGAGDALAELPRVDGLVPAGVVDSRGGVARRGGAPVAVSVLDTRALPGGGAVRKAIGIQAVDALRSPRHVAVPATPVTGHEIVPATGEIGPVRNVAAEETVSDGAGSLWAFAASGVLGVLAGALTLARRVRLDGRR